MVSLDYKKWFRISSFFYIMCDIFYKRPSSIPCVIILYIDVSKMLTLIITLQILILIMPKTRAQSVASLGEDDSGGGLDGGCQVRGGRGGHGGQGGRGDGSVAGYDDIGTVRGSHVGRGLGGGGYDVGGAARVGRGVHGGRGGGGGGDNGSASLGRGGCGGRGGGGDDGRGGRGRGGGGDDVRGGRSRREGGGGDDG